MEGRKEMRKEWQKTDLGGINGGGKKMRKEWRKSEGEEGARSKMGNEG